MTHSNFRGSKGSEHFSIVLLNERSNIMHVNSVISKFSTTTFLCLQRYLFNVFACKTRRSRRVHVLHCDGLPNRKHSEMSHFWDAPQDILVSGRCLWTYAFISPSLMHTFSHASAFIFHSKTHEQESCFYFSSLAFRSIDPLNFIHMQ